MAAEAEARKPSVLWLTSSYPRYQNDSASVFLRYLAEALAEQHFDIRVLAPDHPDLVATDSAVSLKHFRYSLPRRSQLLAYGSGILPNLRAKPALMLQVPGFIVAMFFYAVREIVREKPKLIHAHWIFPQGTLAVLLGKLFKIPVLVTAHGSDAFILLLGAGLIGLKRWTVKRASAWTSNTNATAAAVVDKRNRARILPMGIPFDRFSMVSKSTWTNSNKEKKFVLLFVGRLVEKKGVSDLIRACVLLPLGLQEKTELLIVGDGEERESFEALIGSLNIGNRVSFLGRQAHQKLPQYYATADLLVAPSIFEGQGLILLEAMAAGVPVISTRVGGIVEVIQHLKNGLLVEANNPRQLADAIELMIRDDQLRQDLAKAGRITAAQYDWRRVASQFAALYRELIAK